MTRQLFLAPRRSPEIVDGDTTTLVRPYVVAQPPEEQPVRPLCGAEAGPWATDTAQPGADR